jgi:AmiR/NasT family two-component response regulator
MDAADTDIHDRATIRSLNDQGIEHRATIQTLEEQARIDRQTISDLADRAEVDRALIAHLEAESEIDRDKIANLETALITARRIGAAMGVLMTRHRVTDAQAFDLLRRASQNNQRKLREIAEDVILTGTLGKS